MPGGLLLLFVLLLPLPVAADGPAPVAAETLAPPGAETSARAEAYVQLVTSAIEAQQQGDFQGARRLFSEANALEPNARTLRGMGVAAFQAGDMAQAVVDLGAALRHPNKPLDDELRTAVLALLQAARASVARFHVHSEPESAELTLDGQAAPRDEDARVLALPGEHVLSASAAGYATQQQALQAVAGEERSLQITLQPLAAPAPRAALDPPPSEPSPGGALPPPAQRPAARDTASVQARKWMWSTLGVGAAFSVSAGVMSVMGYRRANAIEQRCVDGCEQAYVDDEVARANLDALERGVAITGGLALVSLGTSFGVWLWQRPRQTVRAQLAPGRFWLHARF